MRKFTLFLMSLFLSVGAMAQQLDANATYRIKSADGKYMTIGDNNASAYGNVYVTDWVEENGDQMFRLIPSNGNWKIKSANGEYFSMTVGNGAGWNVNATTNEAEAMEIIFEATTNVNEFYLRKNGNSYFKTDAVSDGSSPYYHVYHDGNNNNRVAFTVEVIIPKYTVTYNYSYNGKVVKSVTNTVEKGNGYPAYDLNLYAASYENAPTGTVTQDEVVTITVTFDLPFEFYEDYAAVEEANGWYNLIMHSNWNTGDAASRYRTYVGAGDNTNLAWGTERSLTNPSDDYYWAFVGNPIEGLKVVNKAKGATHILSSNGSTNPVMLETETLADGYNTTWQIADRKYNVSQAGDFILEGAWFCLKYPNSNNNLNANASNGNVGFWSDNDNGSAILAVKPLTINKAADVATYYSDNYVMIPSNMGAEVYYASGINDAGYMGLESIVGEVIPAQTGVVVKYNTESNVVYAPEITSKGTTAAVSGNYLKGTTKRTLINKDANKAYYALGMVDGEVGFYNAAIGSGEDVDDTQFYNGAFKAYLEMPASSSSAAFYGFDWDGTTGINEVKTENGEVKAIYDLTGRRVEEITAPGIYIVNGKKVLVK